MTAKIYKSVLHNATSIAGEETPVYIGFESEKALSGLTFDYWKPDAIGDAFIYGSWDSGVAQSVDYWAFDVHNLDDLPGLDRIQFNGTNDPTFTSSQVLDTINAADIVEGANVREFTASINYRYFRVTIYSDFPTLFTVDPIIGVIYAGLKLDLPSGIRPTYTPPRLGLVADVLNNTSEAGNFIGRSLKRKHYDFIIKNDYVSKAWIDANWNDLRDYILTRPFFYLWNDLYSDEAVFCWTLGDVDKPRYAYQKYLSFRFRCNGFV